MFDTTTAADVGAAIGRKVLLEKVPQEAMQQLTTNNELKNN